MSLDPGQGKERVCGADKDEPTNRRRATPLISFEGSAVCNVRSSLLLPAFLPGVWVTCTHYFEVLGSETLDEYQVLIIIKDVISIDLSQEIATFILIWPENVHRTVQQLPTYCRFMRFCEQTPSSVPCEMPLDTHRIS